MLSIALSSLNSAAAIAVVLGLCLMFHETGHFVVAKLFRMKVDEFAFGFGPALLSFRRGETLYRFNIFFFIGAYVKIAGMEPGAEMEPRGFHSRPRWQGALVIIAGSFFNILLAILIFTITTAWTGLPDPKDPSVYVGKTATGSPAAKAGLLPGDKIVAVDGNRYSLKVTKVAPNSVAAKAGITTALEFDKVGKREVYTPKEMLVALREAKGPKVEVEALNYEARDFGDQYKMVQLPTLAAVPSPETKVGENGVLPPTPSLKGGAKNGVLPPASSLKGGGETAPEAELGKALGVEFEPMHQGSLVGYINLRPAKTVMLTIERQGSERQVPVTTMVTNGRKMFRDDKGMLYSRIEPIGRIGAILKGATRPAGALESVKIGALRTYGAVATVFISTQAMVKKQVAPELAGPVAIMAISVERSKVGWDAVLNWAGVISSILAIMNLFPFPPFDGFKALLIGIEAIMRRRVPAKLEIMISIVGFVVVVGLGLYLIFKDTLSLIFKGTV